MNTETENFTVLICDDEPHIRESIRYAVNKAGFNYLLASDGTSSYKMACEHKPDMIILDVGMPGMTGYEVCEKLRKLPNMQEMKVLILTAFGQEKDKQQAYDVGANDFLTKPFSPRILKEKIIDMLNG